MYAGNGGPTRQDSYFLSPFMPKTAEMALPVPRSDQDLSITEPRHGHALVSSPDPPRLSSMRAPRTVNFRLVVQKNSERKTAKVSRDLNPPIESKLARDNLDSIGGFKSRDTFAVLHSEFF